MNRFLKALGVAVVVGVIVVVAGVAFLYVTVCTGHPHGMC